MRRVWFRCTVCGLLQQRGPSAGGCNGRLREAPHRRCWGHLVRCEPPDDGPEPFSPAWLEARALQHLIVRP